jgi:hypothetical protein
VPLARRSVQGTQHSPAARHGAGARRPDEPETCPGCNHLDRRPPSPRRPVMVRFRRSRGIKRQQLKWLTYAATFAPLPSLAYEVARGAWQVLTALILPLVPISVGIAILAPGCTRSTGSSTAPWSLDCSPPSSAPSTPVSSWSWARCSAASVTRYRPARLPASPSPSPPYSSRPAVGSRQRSTAASTDAGTTPSRPSRRSRSGYAIRSVSIPFRLSRWPSLTRPWSRPGSRIGFDRPRPTPRAHPQ